MNKDVLFSKDRNDWETPEDLFDRLDRIFGFTLDCAATWDNRKCPRWIGPDTPRPWSGKGENALWMNPPYSPKELVRELVGDVIREAERWRIPGVILVPARTDTVLFQDLIFPSCDVFFFRGRLRFKGAKDTAPFPSALCIAGIDWDAPVLDRFREEFRGEGTYFPKANDLLDF